MDDPPLVDAPRVALGLKFFGRSPGQALTKAEHDQLTDGACRPLTQDTFTRRRSSGNMHELGDTL